MGGIIVYAQRNCGGIITVVHKIWVSFGHCIGRSYTHCFKVKIIKCNKVGT